MRWTDLLIILLYLGITLVIPMAIARRQNDKKDYLLAGKRLHWFPLALADVAAGFSAISLLGAPGFVMAHDLRYLPTLILGIPTIPIIYYFIVPFLYKLNVVSVYSYLENRFCPAFRYFASGLFMVSKLGYLAMAIYTPSLALSAVTGVSVETFICILGIITAISTIVSGMEGIVWLDVMQYFVMIVGILGAVFYF